MDSRTHEKMGNHRGKARKDQPGIFNLVSCWEELSMASSIVQHALLYKNADPDKVLASSGSITRTAALKPAAISLSEPTQAPFVQAIFLESVPGLE